MIEIYIEDENNIYLLKNEKVYYYQITDIYLELEEIIYELDLLENIKINIILGVELCGFDIKKYINLFYSYKLIVINVFYESDILKKMYENRDSFILLGDKESIQLDLINNDINIEKINIDNNMNIDECDFADIIIIKSRIEIIKKFHYLLIIKGEYKEEEFINYFNTNNPIYIIKRLIIKYIDIFSKINNFDTFKDRLKINNKIIFYGIIYIFLIFGLYSLSNNILYIENNDNLKKELVLLERNKKEIFVNNHDKKEDIFKNQNIYLVILETIKLYENNILFTRIEYKEREYSIAGITENYENIKYIEDIFKKKYIVDINDIKDKDGSVYFDIILKEKKI